MNAIVTIDFHNDTLFAVERADGVFIAIKPICETLGIAWNMQLQRLKRDPILAEGMIVMIIPSAGGPQETTCLRLDLVNGWLFTIDESRVKSEETRQRVLMYKRECYRVLFERFHPGRATPRAPHFDPLPTLDNSSVGVWRTKVDLVREARIQFGPARARLLWAELGLPAVPELTLEQPVEDVGDAWECLLHLISYTRKDATTVAEMLLLAQKGDTRAVKDLADIGIKPFNDGRRDGFLLANGSRWAESRCAGTRWHSGVWRKRLRALPGAGDGGSTYCFAGTASRATFLPWSVLARD